MSIEPNISSLTTVELFGNGSVPVHYKQTSEQVLDRWDQLMQGVNDIININGTLGTAASTQISPAQATALENSINGLINLANNGHEYTITTGTPPAPKDVTDFITVQMAQDLDNLLRTIEGAEGGAQFTLGSASISLNAAKAWRDFAEATPVIRQIVQHMNSARAVGGVWSLDGGYLDGVVDSAGRLQVGSLQSMIELLYVKTGNELMADNLEKLESALLTNKNALESLTALQNMHNEITAFSKGEQPLDVGALFPNSGGAPNDITRRSEYNNDATIAAFYDSIIPELGPGMASAYDILKGYNDAGEKLFNSSFVTQWPFVLTNLDNAISRLTVGTGPLGWNDTNRSQLVQTIRFYRDNAVPYNAAITRLNALMEPYIALLGLPPGSSFPIVMPGEVPLIFTSIPVKLLPVLPDFSADDIPFAETTTGSPEVTGSPQSSLNFRDQLLTPFRNAFAAQFAVDPTFPDPRPFAATTYDFMRAADGIYNNPKIVNGNPDVGLGPIAHLAMAIDIQKQYQILKDQLAALALNPDQLSSPNSLHASLQKVIADLKQAGIENLPPAGGFAGYDADGKKIAIQLITAFANKWIIDGLGDKNSSFSGKIQENLDTAIAAGESLNDQQKEETRRFLFLFEEFYKSASAILTKITELIQKMAQNINK